jgi:ferritin
MALNKQVVAILNKQLEMEFDAATAYNGMYIYFDIELFKGFAAWFKDHVGEEMSHAQRIIQFMLDKGVAAQIPATKAPKVSYASPLAAMKAALAHERQNTAGIYACLKVAAKVDDPATTEMLQWLVKEQVEEEAWAEEYAQMVERCQASLGALYAFDHVVAKRVAK